MKRLAIFASGSGSNAQKIIEYFRNSATVEVALVVSNNADAYVLQRADNFEIPTQVVERNELNRDGLLLELLQKMSIDFIILAGFLLLVPKYILDAFPGRVINIHPSLLPKYGGKGWYGNRVHEAVLKNRERESGITIHFVNEKFDKGEIILQVKVRVEENDNVATLAHKIQQAEHHHYPMVIESIIRKREPHDSFS